MEVEQLSFFTMLAPALPAVAVCCMDGDRAENRENLMLDDVTHWMPNITGPEREESGA